MFLALAFITCASIVTSSPPSLDSLFSIWQTNEQQTYGAASVTNSWGSLLASTSNVLGFNALEVTPFSSGWDSTLLYGWPNDTASMQIDGSPVSPTSTLWTPYSVIRNGSALTADGVALQVATEVRMVFEDQAVLLQAQVILPPRPPSSDQAHSTYSAPLSFTLSVDFSLPLRYYPRGDLCPSWHYPTHSVPCCFNWFPPQPSHGTRAFSSSWHACATTGSNDTITTAGAEQSYATILQQDALSAASSAFSFASACAAPPAPAVHSRGNHTSQGCENKGSTHLSTLRCAQRQKAASSILLGAPDSVSGTTGSWAVQLPARASGDVPTVFLQMAMVFTNGTDPSATTLAAQDLASSWEAAWAYAQQDWQDRFNSAFDPSGSHFSGSLPLVTASVPMVNEGTSSPSPFNSSIEHIYYHSIISMLANERTNLPAAFPATSSTMACPVDPTGVLGGQRMGVHQQHDFSSAESAPLAGSPLYLSAAADSWEVVGDNLLRQAPLRGVRRHLGAHLSSVNGPMVRVKPLLQGAQGLPASLGLKPRRTYLAGGGMNSSTNAFYWDFQYSAQLLSMLDPQWIRQSMELWLAGADPDTGIPSYWSFWGYDYASQRGVGNYYGANDMALFSLLHAYVRSTGDWAWLNRSITSTFPNGTVIGNSTVYDIALDLTTHWKSRTVPGIPYPLADYGGAANLLECVPSYIHGVASLNAANTWMSSQMAVFAEHWAGDNATAQALRADADLIASAVLSELYIPPSVNGSEAGGVWLALYPNGTRVVVRHVMDYTYVMAFMGPQGNTSAQAGQSYLPAGVMAQMQGFVSRELLVPHWMRALSLNDTAAPYSNRSDHGPSGAYIGWPATVVRAMGQRGDYSSALAFLNDTDFCAWLGPYGQAIQVRPPGAPYKPMDVTLYNAGVSAAWADTVLQTLFGFAPPLTAPGTAGMPALRDAGVSRGFTGSALGIPCQGQLYDIHATEGGLTIQAAQVQV